MSSRLRDAWAVWRRLGPRRFARALLRLAAARTSAPLRRARLRARPLRADTADVRAALGGQPLRAALRGQVLAALPAAAAWERELTSLTDSVRSALLARADAVAAHRFDLLGSGPVDLGPEIDWQRDFKHGRSWPLDHISQVTIAYGDGSDIKVPWELSRFQHAPLLAAAHRVSGDVRYRDELGAQLTSWIAANPVEFGPNWACTMDVAIRAANWVAALTLMATGDGELPAWADEVAASLLLHGRFIRTHLEWGEVRGNHYLSDVAGLLPVAALFSGSAEGRAWASWATGELEREMAYQVREDGCDHEASISYHRLVTELFICGRDAAQALSPGRLSPAFHRRLDLMLEFVADHTRPDGLAPQVGDADSGRFLPLGDYGSLDFRDHRHLFTQAGRPVPDAAGRVSAAYAAGGYHVLRAEGGFALIRCGDVGLDGVGGHAHNDQLSFELCAGVQPLIVDPGAYLYTADPAERNRFRSTASHATLMIDGAEQNPLREDYLFSLEDQTRAQTLSWEPRVAGGGVWSGRHHGYRDLPEPATHERRIELDAGELRISDIVTSNGAHELTWSFPLAPGAEVAIDDACATARWPSGAALEIDAAGCAASVEPGWVSPAYGVREPSSVVRLTRRSLPGDDRQQITLRYRARA